MVSTKVRMCRRASSRFAFSIILWSSVTNLPAVRWLYTSPCRSSSASARCMVLGFTPASVARSRTDGSRSPGANTPEAMPTWICSISWA